MNPERFAMLAPKSVDMRAVGGGIANVTPEDVAGAMHELDRLEWELLTAKYCGANPHGLYAEIFKELKSDELSQQVIVHIVGHNNCPKCEGVGELMVNGKKIVCEFCEGTGKYYYGNGEALEHAVRWLQQVEAVALSKVEVLE